jgi:rfaE bifunctional protein kinase chain/domain
MQDILAGFKGKRMLVVGDILLDWYTVGNVERISPEAPVPVLRKSGERFVLGGAGNVAANLCSLGAQVALVGVLGQDEAGVRVRSLAAGQGIAEKAILAVSDRPTSVKHRIVAGIQQIVRVDEESTAPLSRADEVKLYAFLEPQFRAADAVIFSDYGKGVFSGEFASRLIALGRELGKTMIADMKPARKNYFRGEHLIAPNLREALEMAGRETAHEAGEALALSLACHVLVTCGHDGIMVFPREGGRTHVPGRTVTVYDVSGAGDTVTAVAALGLASGLELTSIAALANAAASVVVQKVGTATLTTDELLKAFIAPQ